MSRYYATPYPDSLFSELFALNEGKPMAIAEMGFSGAPVTTFGTDIRGSDSLQNKFITDVLREADSNRAPRTFV